MTPEAPRPFKPWRLADVVDVEVPAFALRTYLEQAEVRRYLGRAAGERTLARAAEVGCGYGRLLPVLSEFAERVTGFERQPEFAAEAAKLHPTREIVRVESLARLPSPDRAFDFVLTFTVLQHLTDPVKALMEMRRVLKPGGVIGVREEDTGGVLFSPSTPTLDESMELYVRC